MGSRLFPPLNPREGEPAAQAVSCVAVGTSCTSHPVGVTSTIFPFNGPCLYLQSINYKLRKGVLPRRLGLLLEEDQRALYGSLLCCLDRIEAIN